MWFQVDSFALSTAQAVTVALPAAGLPTALARFRGSAWALILPLSIAVVVGAIALSPRAADVLAWTALLLVPFGAALAVGWAMHGARIWLVPVALLAFLICLHGQQTAAGQWATIGLIAGSCVTVARLVAGLAPVSLVKAGLVLMALVDAVLVFGNQLQAPNAVLNAAVPAPSLPQLQYAQLHGASLGYGDFLAAAVLGGVLAVEGRSQWRVAIAVLAATLLFDQLFLRFDTLPATVPPAIVLVLLELRRRARSPCRPACGADDC